MTLEYFEEGTSIIREGSIGDKFYIIYIGKVGVYKNTKVVAEARTKERQTSVISRKLCELTNGDSFGELALMHDSPRSASVIAQEVTDCIVLTQETYIRVV